MNSFEIVIVLAVVALTAASPRPRQSEDEDLGRAFIECARKAILTGIPEIGVPSHNPLVISRNVTQNINLGALRGSLALHNMVMEDIPNWEVTQFKLVDGNDGVDVFNYTIYWPKIILKLQWEFSAQLGHLNVIENEGSMALEYDHVNFEGVLNFTKPRSGRNELINELSLDVTALDAQGTNNQSGGGILLYRWYAMLLELCYLGQRDDDLSSYLIGNILKAYGHHVQQGPLGEGVLTLYICGPRNLNITNLGKIGDLINEAGGPSLAFWLNHNPAKDLLGVGLKLKLNRDWFNKPERIDTLIEKCKE